MEKTTTMKVAITGAQFKNTGAQSLLFSLVNEIYMQYPDAEIYYIPVDSFRDYNYRDYNFYFAYDDLGYRDFKNEKLKIRVREFLSCVKNRILLRRKAENTFSYSNVIRKIDVLIDVSGYALTSRFTNTTNYKLVRHINDARKNGAKVILMPQSFGPFEYKKNAQKMKKLIASSLGTADIIFAREQEGYNLLRNQFCLDNVFLSCDSVLQAAPVIASNIYSFGLESAIPSIKSKKNNVGIIPNQQTMKFGDEHEVLNVYKVIIDKLLELNKNVYIFRHSEDLDLCKKIFGLCNGDSRVYLIEDHMDCFSYSRFVREFDFIIASRYHAIIHAYKQGIPAIILGWAIKYTDLAELMNQNDYIFDITSASLDESKLLAGIAKMSDLYQEESTRILKKIADAKSDSCYKRCWKTLSNSAQGEITNGRVKD